MAVAVLKDRVKETSTTTGTGTYTLAGAVTGYQAFSVAGNGALIYYSAWEVDANGNANGGWEVGVGIYTSAGTTLFRAAILSSSNSGAAVSWAAGTRHLAFTMPAAAFGIPSAIGTTQSDVFWNSMQSDTFMRVKDKPYTDVMYSSFNVSASIATTTGSMSSGTNSLTVASSAGYSVGQGIYIVDAAGANAVLETYIALIVGNVITLNANASATVSSVEVGHSDTRGLQAAIDFAGQFGFVYTPEGNYNISQMKIRGDMRFLGAGIGSTIFWSIPQNALNMVVLNTATIQRVEMGSFRLDGNNLLTSTKRPTFQAQIYFNFNAQAQVDQFFDMHDLFLTYAPNDAINLFNMGTSFWRHIWTDFPLGHGLMMTKDTVFNGSTCDQHWISCNFSASGLHGVWVKEGRDNVFVDCEMYFSGIVDAVTYGAGLYLGGGSAAATIGTVVSGCRVDDNYGHGVVLDSAVYSNLDFTNRGQNGDYIRVMNNAQNNAVRMVAEPSSIGRTPDTIVNIQPSGGKKNTIDVIHYDPSSVVTVPVQGAEADLSSNKITIANGGGASGDAGATGGDVSIFANQSPFIQSWTYWEPAGPTVEWEYPGVTVYEMVDD